MNKPHLNKPSQVSQIKQYYRNLQGHEKLTAWNVWAEFFPSQNSFVFGNNSPEKNTPYIYIKLEDMPFFNVFLLLASKKNNFTTLAHYLSEHPDKNIQHFLSEKKLEE